MKAYQVLLNGHEIDIVFWVDNSTEDEVKRSLINHDGYDPRIVVIGPTEDESKRERR
jgi:hypothetical protein